MMDSGHTVGRGGAFEENERFGAFAQIQALAEQVFLIPSVEDIAVYL